MDKKYQCYNMFVSCLYIVVYKYSCKDKFTELRDILEQNLVFIYIEIYMYIYDIYLANGLHKAEMKNLRHCVSCLAQSSGRGCCCCRGLSVTYMYLYILYKCIYIVRTRLELTELGWN